MKEYLEETQILVTDRIWGGVFNPMFSVAFGRSDRNQRVRNLAKSTSGLFGLQILEVEVEILEEAITGYRWMVPEFLHHP